MGCAVEHDASTSCGVLARLSDYDTLYVRKLECFWFTICRMYRRSLYCSVYISIKFPKMSTKGVIGENHMQAFSFVEVTILRPNQFRSRIKAMFRGENKQQIKKQRYHGIVWRKESSSIHCHPGRFLARSAIRVGTGQQGASFRTAASSKPPTKWAHSLTNHRASPPFRVRIGSAHLRCLEHSMGCNSSGFRTIDTLRCALLLRSGRDAAMFVDIWSKRVANSWCRAELATETAELKDRSARAAKRVTLISVRLFSDLDWSARAGEISRLQRFD
jgi:hypothetical protein